MVASVLLLALAGAASAVNFQTWTAHNGLVTDYNTVLKYHSDFYNLVNSEKNGVTVFVPTNDAWKRWQSNSSNTDLSYTAVEDLFKYMAVHGEYTMKDLETVTELTTLLSGQSIKIRTSGVAPALTVYASSGTNYQTNSTIGVQNTDFRIANGYVQLVDTVFQLPSSIEKTADADKASQSGASKNALGALSVLSLLGVGLMAVF